MPKPHQVDKSEFKDYVITQEMCGSHGLGDSKSLNIIVEVGDISTVSYEVVNKKNVILKTNILDKALEKYNLI
jgi:hypothetical protein